MGQRQTWDQRAVHVSSTSIAEELLHREVIRALPGPHSCSAANDTDDRALFDHFIGTRERCGCDGETDRLGGRHLCQSPQRIPPLLTHSWMSDSSRRTNEVAARH